MHKNLLIKLLGLEETASDEQISNAATTFQADIIAFKEDMEARNDALTNSAAKAEQRAVAAEAQAETLTNSVTSLTTELVDQDLETYKEVITNAEEVKAALISNREGTITVLKNVRRKDAGAGRAAPIHDPKKVDTTLANGKVADVTGEEKLKNDSTRAKRISNRAREIASTLKLSHQQAFMMAKNEESQAA